MRRKIIALIMAFGLTLGLAACGGGGGGGATVGGEVANIDDGVTKICLLINGNLGDMSFFDSANAGMQKLKKDHPEITVNVVEMGTDNTRWEPTLRKTANSDYDLIILGTSEMREPLQRLTRMSAYKDRRFILFDTEIEDNKAANYSSVHSMLFKQNEGGFLAGALAATLTNSYGKASTAFIGGMKIDIINDFGYGFMQGVKKADADKSLNIKAANSYIGDFTNSPRGKSLADAYYEKMDILFAAASQAGQGCVDSAKNKNKYIIGVDSDQYEYYKATDKVKADRIVTSVLKRVDLALYEACEKFMAGTLTYGDLEYIGLKEGKIGLADNENYQKLVSQEIRDYIDGLETSIIDGSLTVKSGLKRYTTIDEINALYDEMKP